MSLRSSAKIVPVLHSSSKNDLREIIKVWKKPPLRQIYSEGLSL